MMNIRYPNINGKTEEEQLNQIKSYLRQLVDQLNWALSTLETHGQNNDTNASQK